MFVPKGVYTLFCQQVQSPAIDVSHLAPIHPQGSSIVLRKESVFTAEIPLILPVNTRQWDWRLCSQWIASDCSRLLSTMPMGAYCALDCVDKYLTFVGNILLHVFH